MKHRKSITGSCRKVMNVHLKCEDAELVEARADAEALTVSALLRRAVLAYCRTPITWTETLRDIRKE